MNNYNLFPKKTALDETLKIFGLNRRSRVDEIFEMIGLNRRNQSDEIRNHILEMKQITTWNPSTWNYFQAHLNKDQSPPDKPRIGFV